MDSTSVRPANFLTGYADDINLLRSFRNLALKNHDGLFNTNHGIPPSSPSSFWPSLNLFPAKTQEGSLEFPLNGLNEQIHREADMGYHPFHNRGDTLNSNMCSASENLFGSMDDYSYQDYNPFGRNSTPTTPSILSQGLQNYGLNYSPEVYYRDNVDCNDQDMSSATQNKGYYIFGDYNLPIMMQSPGGYSNRQCANWGGVGVKNLLERGIEAMQEHDFNCLLGPLQNGDPSVVSFVLDGVIDNLMVLIAYEDGFKLFRTLISQCKDSQLAMIVEKITSDYTSLGMAVSTQFGSYSVQSLIRRLRHTDLARLVTSALSFDIFSMASTTWGRSVIKMCFSLLDRRANEVLYDEVIANCYELSMDRGGCITVSDCIDSIESPLRGWLLDRICEESACFALDPSGTYVVQKVLKLGNKKYSSMICEHLQGKYIQLSLLKHGSYTVEKCLKATGCRGLYYFAKEIAEEKSLLEKLARHEFGNFVVKAALDVSKMEPSGKYYRFFVKILEPCFQQLEKTMYGVHVVRQIQGRDQTSPENEFGWHQ